MKVRGNACVLSVPLLSRKWKDALVAADFLVLGTHSHWRICVNICAYMCEYVHFRIIPHGHPYFERSNLNVDEPLIWVHLVLQSKCNRCLTK